MKKIYLLILWGLFIGNTFAENKIIKADCNTGALEYLKSFGDTYNFDNLSIIKKEDYQIALKNLKKYCNKDGPVLQSPYFINHLLDIGFRKLDGVDPLTYGINFDLLAKQWREYLNQVDENTRPDDISKKFDSIRGKAEDTGNKGKLYGKYVFICHDLNNITTYAVSKKNKMFKINNIYNKCLNLANQRYQSEASLVNSLIIRSFYKRIDTKLYESFFQKNDKSFSDKLMKLYDNFTIALGDFQYLVLRFVKVIDANK